MQTPNPLSQMIELVTFATDCLLLIDRFVPEPYRGAAQSALAVGCVAVVAARHHKVRALYRLARRRANALK